MKYLLILSLLIVGQFITNCFAFVCEGDGFYGDPDDCAKFYRCVSGTKYSFNCGPGTHFNPNCDCCDWPYNVNCQANSGRDGQPVVEQPVRYQQQPSLVPGQDYSQTQYTSGQQYVSGQQYAPQSYGGQQQYDPNAGQSYGQYGASGQQYTQQPSSSGQSYGQLYGNSYNPQYGEASGQLSPNYGQTGQQQQPVYQQYGQSGQPVSGGGGHRQHSNQSPQRQPQESRVRQQTVDQTDDQSIHRRPTGRQYPKTDRRGEQPIDEVITDDVVAKPKQRTQPKPRPSQPKARQPNNDLPEEDFDEFDHKFDELIDETTTQRPKPRPKPRQRPPQRQKPVTREPEVDNESDEEDIDEQQEVVVKRTTTTTRRPRVPTRKYRIKTTTAATDEDNSVEDQQTDNEFAKFDNQVKTDKSDGKDKESDETNKWLFEEDIEKIITSTTTTTEDPFVSLLKARVPTNTRNRTRVDRNRQFGRRYGTTTSTTSTASPSDDEVTTLDPFDKEWADFNARKSNPRSAKPRHDYIQSSSSVVPNRKPKPESKTADPSDELITYFNCTEAGKPCDVCEELDWIKYSDIALQAATTPYRSFKFLPVIAAKQCYKACAESATQCVAFSYDTNTGICHTYDQLAADSVTAKRGTNTVIKNPKNVVVNDEWIHTRNGFISGDELYSIRADSVWDCLRECAKDIGECLAVDFDEMERKCRVFNGNEGKSVGQLKANAYSLQHMSVFDDTDTTNQWRFDDIGYKTLANARPIRSLIIQEPEECFYECIENSGNNCSYITIEEDNTSSDDNPKDNKQLVDKHCYIYAYNSTAKWIKSKSKSNHSFALTVPTNHSLIHEYPGYTYVGNPVEIKEGMTVDQCREYAQDECPFCRKYTAIVETKECALFSDSALLSPAIRETNYTERSAMLAMPVAAPEYMAYRRLPWKMFTTDVNPYEIKGQIDGQQCLEFCLEQRECVATALVYDTQYSSMFCYFFKRQDLRDSNVTEYENVDLFVKVLTENEVPGHHPPVQSGNRSAAAISPADCSDGQPLDNKVVKSGKKSDTSADNHSYGANSYPLSPHDDYYGSSDDGQSTPVKKGRVRAVRATDTQYRRQQNSDNLDVEDTPKPTGNAIPFLDSVRQSARKESIVEQLPSISSELRRLVKKARKKADRPATSGQRSGERVDRLTADTSDCENEFDDTIGCSDGGQQEVKDNFPEMCAKLPKIVYLDTNRTAISCNNTTAGQGCRVVCRAGYEPTLSALNCQLVSGNRSVWHNWRQIRCKPIDNICQSIDGNSNDKTSLVRIKSMTQFPEQRLHFVTKYNISSKLPQFSAYIHIKQNNLNQTDHPFGDNANAGDAYVQTCDQLVDNQWTDDDYQDMDYAAQPLLPPQAFMYSPEAYTLATGAANRAPMDAFTSLGPWATIENRTLEMLNGRPGVVIGGVCPDSIPAPKTGLQRDRQTKALKLIPKCFWRIVCVPAGDSDVTTAVFYAENTPPISQLDKQSRVDQVRKYRDQRFAAKLMGTDSYRQVWLETYNAFKDLNRGIKSFIYRCADTHVNTPDGVQFWDGIINGQSPSVQSWPTNFRYGRETAVRDRSRITRRQMVNKSDTNDQSGSDRMASNQRQTYGLYYDESIA